MQPPPPLLLQTQLRAAAGNKVKLRLRCAATSGSCAGSGVTLDARFVQTRGHGQQRRRRVILTRLARSSFRDVRGDFTVSVALDSSAMARLRAHGNRLAVQVAISSATGRVRVVSAVLT